VHRLHGSTTVDIVQHSEMKISDQDLITTASTVNSGLFLRRPELRQQVSTKIE